MKCPTQVNRGRLLGLAVLRNEFLAERVAKPASEGFSKPTDQIVT